MYRESTDNPGRDPFSGTVVVGNPPGTKSQTPIGASGGGVSTIPGDVPALYGGSRNEHVCDRQKLITFLQQNPDKAAAWAGVLGIDTADIATYIGTLTPLQLRADTRVTNHGFVNGHATSLQSVLQAGTAVLADDQGRPRVKCGCGNPLLDPIATPVTPVYSGDDWPGFDPGNLSAVTSASVRVARFVVYDLRTGETFYRPRGTDGDEDQLTTPPAVTTTEATPTPTDADADGRGVPGGHPPERVDLRRRRAAPMSRWTGSRRRQVRPDPDLVSRREPCVRRRRILRQGRDPLPGRDPSRARQVRRRPPALRVRHLPRRRHVRLQAPLPDRHPPRRRRAHLRPGSLPNPDPPGQ